MAQIPLLVTLASLLLWMHVEGHGMHGMHAMHDMAAMDDTTDYKCPVCRMSTLGYDNINYVQMTNGQKIYTCGMDARTFSDYSFKSTDTAYLAANMAEFVVNHTDTEDYSTCANECPECADGITDPITGDTVTTDNFVYVCLTNGQKIYFASQTSKNKYLSNVNQKPRYAVDKVICSDATCSDATQITELSAAAKAMVPDLSSSSTSSSSTTESSSSTSSASAATNTESTDTSDDFCTGEGSVMFNGFQSTINGSCVRLFFHPWVLNSAFKYVLGFFGCFGIAILNEYLVKCREQVRQKLIIARKTRPLDKMHKYQCKLVLTILYMLQMTIAYLAMLVVMIYESGLFIALVLGFGVGFLLFKNLDMDVSDERGVWRYTDPSTIRIRVGGMSCMANCGTTVENALKNTPGVTNAYVDFGDQVAYVAGSATSTALIEAIEGVGFSGEIDGSETSSNV